MSRESDHVAVELIKARRAAQAADTAAASSWLARGLAALEPERPAPDPRVVHQLPVVAEDRVNPYDRARQVRAAQAQAMADPYMADYIAERRQHVPSAPFGEYGYNNK
jgi:hypothetical protein